MKLRVIFISLLFTFLFNAVNGYSISRSTLISSIEQKETETVKMIKDFYVAYATNVANAQDPIAANASLVQANLTKSLIDKMQKLRITTGADPIIRAQDFDLNWVKTIAVKHVKGNSYIVSYKGYQDKVTKFPLKVIEMNGRCYIDYIATE